MVTPKPKKKKPIVTLGRWETQAAFSYIVEREADRLMMMVQTLDGSSWGVVALETPKAVASADDVFQNHSHKMVGNYRSVKRAIVAAESFAKAWKKGHVAAALAHCECPEIAPVVESTDRARVTPAR